MGRFDAIYLHWNECRQWRHFLTDNFKVYVIIALTCVFAGRSTNYLCFNLDSAFALLCSCGINSKPDACMHTCVVPGMCSIKIMPQLIVGDIGNRLWYPYYVGYVQCSRGRDYPCWGYGDYFGITWETAKSWCVAPRIAYSNENAFKQHCNALAPSKTGRCKTVKKALLVPVVKTCLKKIKKSIVHTNGYRNTLMFSCNNFHTILDSGWFIASVASFQFVSRCLTHGGRDKMAANFLTTFSTAFSWMEMCEFRLRGHWNLFLRFE